jgi:hypothetical protein
MRKLLETKNPKQGEIYLLDMKIASRHSPRLMGQGFLEPSKCCRSCFTGAFLLGQDSIHKVLGNVFSSRLPRLPRLEQSPLIIVAVTFDTVHRNASK